jgi:hypothetical protein
MVKPSNLPLAEAIIKRCILATEGISAINDFALSFDSQTRNLIIKAAVSTIYGTTATIRVIQGSEVRDQGSKPGGQPWFWGLIPDA